MIKKIVLGLVCIFFVLIISLTIPFANTPTQSVHTLTHADAILVHGYWFSQKENGPIVLSIRSQLAIKAASIVYFQGKTSYIVLDAGPIWGNAYPTLGKEMEKQLEAQGVPQNNIIVRDIAMDTYEEVAEFLQLAKQYHWKALGDIAALQQDISIPTLYKNQNSQATYMTIENIITTQGTGEDKKLLASLWPYEPGFRLYENIVRVTLFFDPQYQLLGHFAKSIRAKKAPYGSIPFLPIDSYNL